MSSKRIAILLHADNNTFESSRFIMRFLVEAWREMGYSVELLKGVNRYVPADVIIPHIDLTVIPDEYVAFMHQYPIVVNRQIVDISKSKISTNKVAKGDTYAGPVIVKTERNYGGCPEKKLKERGVAARFPLTQNPTEDFTKLVGLSPVAVGKR